MLLCCLLRISFAFAFYMQLFVCHAVLIVDRLSLLLAKERSHSQTYLGCMKKGPVFTDPKLKWLVLECFFSLWFLFDDFTSCSSL